MASVKNAKPSNENGIPMMAPACSMKPGQSKPSSKESTVPETAPTANKIAVPFAHRLQRSRYTGCFVRRYIPSAIAISSGIPIPSAAKTMWKASDIAICERAKRKSLIRFQRDRFHVLINPKHDLSCSRRRKEAELSERNARPFDPPPHVGGYFWLEDSSSRWIRRRVRLINSRITGIRISTLRRADYKRENGAYEHDSSNDFEGLSIMACALADVRDQGRPTHAGETPGRQHQSINGADVSRTEEVSGKCRHRPEAPAVT